MTDLLARLGLGGFEAFHFLRPQWLWVLLAAVALLLIVRWRDDVRRRWRDHIAPHLLDALVVEPRRRWRIRPVHLTALAIALGAIALAGPTWQQEKPPFVQDQAPLAIAIDLSREMDATDVTPTRLERAKLKVKALLAQRAGARTAIYAYAGTTHLVLPLTDDAALIQTFVDALQTRIMPRAGRDTALAIRTIDAMLGKEDVPGTMLFLSGGVEPAATAAFKAQRDSGRSLPVVLAIGTERGGPVRSGTDGFAEDAGGRRLFAKLDVAALERLRKEAGIPLATLTPDSDDDIKWVQRQVQSHLQQKDAEANTRWRDGGWWLTIPIAMLAALWFRKGWTIRWVSAALFAAVLAAGVPALPQDAFAQDGAKAQGFRFIDLWLTRDQQGRLAFERGDYAEAAGLFDDPMWRGIAMYRAQRPADAVQAFVQVDSAESDFNQGDALAKLGRFKAAAARFEAALGRRPDWKEAQANLALVRSLIPPDEKDDDEDDEEPPDIPPDEIKFDNKSNKGKQVTMVADKQTAETWMRTIQTTPTELLARRFQIQAAHGADGARK